MFIVTRDEILELNCPFGCGDSPIFTYPFFGEDQMENLKIPSGTPETVLESLEIVLCIETGFASFGNVCFLGSNDEGILRDARDKIEGKLKEMTGGSVKFLSSWTDYQEEIKAHDYNNFSKDDYEIIEPGVYKLINPQNRAKMYNRLQILLPFFIEAATPIDSSDPKWTIYLKAKVNEESGTLRIMGLLTTYSYFKYPEGLRVRISQVLIFPRDQGNRLGTGLYQAVTRNLINDPECSEICVEDPTDGFERIRGLVDWREAKAKGIFNDDNGKKENDDNIFIISELVSKLKLTTEHAERILNLDKSLHLTLNSSSNKLSAPKRSKQSTNDPLLISLRQQIKRWLLRKYRKELPDDQGDRIEKLSQLYETEMEEFIEPLIELINQNQNQNE